MAVFFQRVSRPLVLAVLSAAFPIIRLCAGNVPSTSSRKGQVTAVTREEKPLHPLEAFLILAKDLPEDNLVRVFSPACITELVAQPEPVWRQAINYAQVFVRLSERLPEAELGKRFTPGVVEKLAQQVQWYDKTPLDICGTWGDSSAHALLVLAKRMSPAELTSAFSATTIECLAVELAVGSRYSGLCAHILVVLVERMPEEELTKKNHPEVVDVFQEQLRLLLPEGTVPVPIQKDLAAKMRELAGGREPSKGEICAQFLISFAERALLPGAVAPAEPEELSHLGDRIRARQESMALTAS